MAADDKTPEGPTSENDQMMCDRKCIYQDDRVCYNEAITKELLNTVPENSTHSSLNSKSEDSLHSGESLFKTFTFNAEDSNPDMEKCMNFWKSILSKNAKPLKCTVLKPNKEEPKKVPPKPESPKDDWLKIYKDLQRRRLDQIKLVNKKSCDPCPPSFEDENEKNEEIQEIKRLNSWKPKSQKPKVDVNSQMQRTMEALQNVRSSMSSEDRKKTKQTISASNSRASSIKSTEAKAEQIKENVEKNTEEKQPEAEKKSSLVKRPVDVEPKVVEATPKTPVEEIPTQEKPPEPEPEKPCSCGCATTGCLCTGSDSCKSLQDCTDDCICPGDICACGCRIEDCICESTSCPCGCGVKECICGALDENVCSCGCGFEECICEQLYNGKTCKCGSANCDCDTIEILNAYLESLETSKAGGDKEAKMVVSECQTGEEITVKMTKKPRRYCVICGHYDCYCTEEREK